MAKQNTTSKMEVDPALSKDGMDFRSAGVPIAPGSGAADRQRLNEAMEADTIILKAKRKEWEEKEKEARKKSEEDDRIHEEKQQAERDKEKEDKNPKK